MMRRKPCALLVMLMVLLSLGLGPDSAVSWAAPGVLAVEAAEPAPSRLAPSDTGLAFDDECAAYGQKKDPTTTPEFDSIGFCLPGLQFERLVVEYHHEEIEKRERRRRRLEREHRERIAKRRAEERAALNRCATRLAAEYASKEGGARVRAAPLAVKAVICAASEIDEMPYSWGGGHADFSADGEGENGGPGYDCSGAVSYALHGGGFLDIPLNSSHLEGWGSPGPGRWITVYTNAEHAWMVVAGVRFDTREPPPGTTGPRWHSSGSSPAGFVARHPSGY